ncbi:hypothetical protein HJFPF1_07005 [Paramyrothecium foliicola]|nr:hypothetical protein HJFPF1_07005 [Paramyrothecium foliicola]
MEDLPVEERLLVWQETERNFWDDIKRQWAKEQDEAEKAFHQATLEVKVEIGRLTGQCSQLTDTQSRLAKQLAEVEAELSHIAKLRDDKANTLNNQELDYRDKQQERLATRQKVTKAMTEYFRNMRGDDASEPDAHGVAEYLEEAQHKTVPSMSMSMSMQGVEPTGPLLTSADTTNAAAPTTNGHDLPRSPSEHLVDITDADGQVIGSVERIEPWNPWVEAIQNVPIQRPVKIRRGRKFTTDHLANIYERTEAKGVKWLSCMIQATGAIQTKRCISCDKNQGAFDDCIILGGDLFQKCGNCEWNRQGCHGASGEAMESVPSRVKRIQDLLTETEPEEAEEQVVREHEDDLRARRKQAAEAALAKAAGLNLESPANIEPSTPHAVNGRPPTQERRPLPDRVPTHSEPREYPMGGFTPANGRSRPPSHEAQTPTNASVEASPQPTPILNPESFEEITSANLVLRNDGTVYTYPECVQGVPLVKIDESHPYWDPSWPNVRSVIEPALQIWKAKNQQVLDEEAKGEKRGSAKYQTGRQVNRGIRILEFLEEGEISPYQLLSKRYTQSGKGGITSYDTLFRLSETLYELSKFNLGIKPADWVRHRLHELILEQGPEFNYAKTMHDFYHDPKLTALRSKHGFKNIGRPSGAKVGRQSLGSTMSTPRAQPKKRKGTHSQSGTPRDSPSVERSPLVTYATLPPDPPFSTHLQKRPKPLAPAEGLLHDEFYTEYLSETDSLCHSRLFETDWRLYQVKTRLYTSSTNVTQYWTWQPNKRRFEFQVLTEIEPAKWGTLREPINFNCLVDEIVEIRWSTDALRIKIVARRDKPTIARKDGQPRGDIMAAFKRANTMKRFLKFCRANKVNLVKVPRYVYVHGRLHHQILIAPIQGRNRARMAGAAVRTPSGQGRGCERGVAAIAFPARARIQQPF